MIVLLKKPNQRFKMDTGKIYDVSPEEMDRMKRRKEIRKRLKQEFNKEFYNPMRLTYRVEMVISN